MTEDIDRFVQLCKKFAEIDLSGEGPPTPPWGNEPTLQALKDAIDQGAPGLPQSYQDAYVTKLRDKLPDLLHRPSFSIETYTGPVYQHTPTSEVRLQLQRFLVVISNIYYSFTSPEGRRVAVSVSSVPSLPPLALFQHEGARGPFTIPIASTFGSTIGVVSLPSTSRNDPVLWTSLAHETGGHDVIFAVQNLLAELQKGVLKLFHIDPEHIEDTSPSPANDVINGLMWSHWMSETAADVYGLLSIGPALMLNFAAYLAALRHRATPGLQQFPRVSTTSQVAANTFLDVHPTDILRIYLAMGVIENLRSLSETTRHKYVEMLEQIAQLCAQDAPHGQVEMINGFLPITDSLARRFKLKATLEEMKANAQLVGKYIATEQLEALANHSIQDIETWDDADELIAQQIAEALQNGASVVNMGDEAQLLAGATLAVIADPEKYAVVNERLAEALDRRYELDPKWHIS